MQLALDEQQAPLPVAAKISVLIPSYGHMHYIKITLDSILRQTRQPDQIIVINDGSPDDTRSAVQPYLDKIMYIEQENRGLVKTVKRGLELCTGDYVCMIASDDWLDNHAFEILAEILDRHPDVGFVHGQVRYVDEMGKEVPENDLQSFPEGRHRDLSRLICANFVAAPAVLCRRAALEDAGGFPDYHFVHDWALWLRILIAGWHMYGCGEQVAYYRRHSTNLTRPANRARALAEMISMLKSLYLEFEDVWSPREARAFKTGTATVRRYLGWWTLAYDRWAAQRCFAHLLLEDADWTAVCGIFLTLLPSPLYRGLKALTARTWTRLPQPLVRVLKALNARAHLSLS